MFRTFLKKLAKPAGRKGRARPFRPRLEALETRELLSSGKVLILGPTVSGGLLSREAVDAKAMGLGVDVVDSAGWQAKTQAQFASYQALILGDPTSNESSTAPLAAALANKSIWGPVVNGNVIVLGADPAAHAASQAGAEQLIKDGIGFAAALTGTTGMYLDLNAYYANAGPKTPVPLLDPFGPGAFTISSVSGTDNSHLVATSTDFPGLTDANQSGWAKSAQEKFDSFAPGFVPLVVNQRSGSPFLASDGTRGDPYVLVRGASVSPLQAGVTLTPPAASAPVGSPETFTAAVTLGASGSPTALPGKTVVFSVLSGPDAGLTGTGVTDAKGKATFTYAASAAGTDTVLAWFVDAAGKTRASAPMQAVWTAAASTTTVASSSSTVAYGQPVVFTATVAAPVGGPTGSVQFFDGTTTLGSAPLFNGRALLTVPGLAVGPHSITASYGGDSNFTGSTSAPLAQTVIKGSQTIIWVRSPDLVYGTPLGAAQLDATVVGSGPAPGGALTYSPGAGAVLPVGRNQTIIVRAAATNNYNATTAGILINVVKATPSFRGLSTPPVVFHAASVNVSGHLASGNLVPTGKVSVSLNGVTQTAAIQADGSFSASLATGQLAVGSYNVAFSYVGDTNFNSATGTAALMVSYLPVPQFDQTQAFAAGSTVPIKVQLTDAAGLNVSSPTIALAAVSLALASSPGTTVSAASLKAGTPFQFANGTYEFDLDSTGLTPGTYLFTYLAGNDPVPHSVQFVIH
jgi:hypothetical protein